MNAEEFKQIIDTIAQEKGISHEAIIIALKEAMEKSYLKFIGGEEKVIKDKDGNETVYPAARVEVEIDEENGFISLCQVRTIVKEVEDDVLEIELDEAKDDYASSLEDFVEAKSLLKTKEKEKKREMDHIISLIKDGKKNLKLGKEYRSYCRLDDVTKTLAMSVQNVLKGKIAEAERMALYDLYKDHIGEMITGVVERADERGAIINIGRTTAELTRKEMIGDEYFKAGDSVKVYIQEVKSTDKKTPLKGQQIEITRSSEGFLRRLFEEEIHEIFEGTVIIKGIARQAGVRSKVAVYSTNPDIDPTGACIGSHGARIQKIVASLGNAKDKEKIDIIPYSEVTALYLAESLRPAHVLGIKIVDEKALPTPKAIAVVNDG
nr:S1 RNA-binding domain-containing protein [Bacilli bacterium]